MFARIRNGQNASKNFVILKYSKFVLSVLEVIKSEGYIGHFEVVNPDSVQPEIKVELLYHNGSPVIDTIRPISRPGLRVYSPILKLRKSFNGLGVKILSTSKGILTDSQARSLSVGGEVLCEIF